MVGYGIYMYGIVTVLTRHITCTNPPTHTTPQEVDAMKPEEAVAIIEQGISKPPKARRVAPPPPSSFPQPVLDRGTGGGDAGLLDDAIEVVPKAT